MAALLWIAAALIGVLLLVLLTPWHVRVRGRTMPLDLRLRLSLLGGLAPGIPIPIRRSKDRDRPRKKKRKPRKDRRYRGTPRGLRDLILGLLSALRLRNLRLSGRIGLPDPADTGTLWGALTPFIYGLSAPHRRIDVAPEFSGACLDLDGSGDLVIRPTRLLRAGLAFAWANRGWR
jgi:hypothetical protein